MPADSTGWNWTLSEAPPNKRILIQANGYDYFATFDPAWGGGRGAWFDDNNQIIAKPWCFREDVDDYVAKRRKGPNIIPIR